jgi:polygalacturonase
MHYRLILAVLPFLQVCLGQDMRSVTEPSFPPACTQLAANGGSETKLDTDRIQSAMNACAMGQAVELTAGGFVSGPLQIPKGVTLLIDADATLFASRNPRNYDSNTSQTCGTLATSSGGCVPFITANRADGGGIMGYGLIDGQGHLPMMPGGIASSQSWWDLARAASGNLTQNNPRLIQISNSDRFTMYKITLRNSPNFHVAMGTDTNFVAWGVKIITPYDARNTDGIDPGYSSNVTITNSYISDGDDNVAVGGNNSPGAKNISVVNNHFGDGHGASIGSYTLAGVSNILFDHITIAGDTANSNAVGMRIKSDVSRGGLVQNVTYSNICLRNVRAAVVLDPFYTAGATGTLIPSYQNITMRNIHATTEGTVKIQGHDANVPTTILLSNVQIDNMKASDLTTSYVNYTLGPDPVSFTSLIKGTAVNVTNNVSTSNVPYACPASVFSPVAGELIAGPDTSSVQVQVFPTKANLTAPTGTVTIFDGGTAIGSGPASSLMSIPIAPLPDGVHVLTASYSGDTK